MFQKLKQKKGETLVEVLVSLMIALISMSILTLSVITAARLNIETRRLDKAYSEELQIAEGHLPTPTPTPTPAEPTPTGPAPIEPTPNTTAVVQVKIDLDNDGNAEITPSISVRLYGVANSAFVAYERDVTE